MRLLLIAMMGMMLVTGLCTEVGATPTIRNAWNDIYDDGLSGIVCGKLKAAAADCSLCHPGGDTGQLNDYGADMKAVHDVGGTWTSAFEDIEGDDSDGDTFDNLIEIDNCGLPGDASDTPTVPIDDHSWGLIKMLFDE